MSGVEGAGMTRLQPQNSRPSPAISLPNEFVCPITLELMHDPVYLEALPQERICYERRAIETDIEIRLAANQPLRSPLSGVKFQNTRLESSIGRRCEIRAFVAEHPHLHHRVKADAVTTPGELHRILTDFAVVSRRSLAIRYDATMQRLLPYANVLAAMTGAFVSIASASLSLPALLGLTCLTCAVWGIAAVGIALVIRHRSIQKQAAMPASVNASHALRALYQEVPLETLTPVARGALLAAFAQAHESYRPKEATLCALSMGVQVGLAALIGVGSTLHLRSVQLIGFDGAIWPEAIVWLHSLFFVASGLLLGAALRPARLSLRPLPLLAPLELSPREAEALAIAWTRPLSGSNVEQLEDFSVLRAASSTRA